MLRFLSVWLTLGMVSTLTAQTPWPPLCLQGVEWTDEVHHTTSTQPIEAPCVPSAPITITGSADAEFVSGTEVHLQDGFHAGDFWGDGQFHGYINDALGDTADLVLIAPDPATHIVDEVVHVEKWEKLEVGLRLPSAYLDAIDRFFDHYYSNGIYQPATPDSLDREHDLNPFADDSLQLIMTLTSPTATHQMRFGFYMKAARWTSGVFVRPVDDYPNSPLQPYNIRFRFAPDVIGTWHFALDILAPHTRTLADVPLDTLHFSGYSFVCDPPLPENHGPLRLNEANKRVLEFEDGTPFFGLGVNMTDQRRVDTVSSPYFFHYDFDLMIKSMDDMADVGANFLRIMVMKNFRPDWLNLGVYGTYSVGNLCDSLGWQTSSGDGQRKTWVLEQLLEYAKTKGIQVQLCMDPEMPRNAYEVQGWRAHPYVVHYLIPRRDSLTGRYDVKEFFFTGGDTTNTDSGVFYYWKRQYKYLLARWGHLANVSILEPFNEVDGTLTYSTTTPGPNDDMCGESLITWPADSLLPPVISAWHTAMAKYVRGPSDFNDPAHSPLGYSDKLFAISYANGDPWLWNTQAFYGPMKTPQIDIINVHKYNNHEWDVGAAAKHAHDFRDNFPNSATGEKKPFLNGEYATFGNVTYQNTGYATYRYFDNYDVSFHNELWASAFYGSYATGLTWCWERVFWWPGGMDEPPFDADNFDQQAFSNDLGATNLLDVGLIGGYPIVNKTVAHNFKPLAELLNNPDWQSYGFFESDFDARSVPEYPAPNPGGIECYYLINADSNLAIGWVHNLNAYWENKYYLTSSLNEFLSCDSPNTQSIVLEGFQTAANFHVTWFPTRMNSTVYPASQLDEDGNGSITLDLSTAPLNGILDNYLDTVRSDYAFIIALAPVVRRMEAYEQGDTMSTSAAWEFSMYSNPARTLVTLALTGDVFPKDITISDLAGKAVYSRQGATGRLVQISTAGFAQGAYSVRVSTEVGSRSKTLILH